MNTTKASLSYVLITAARNEERYIENTIKSVVLQTILPKKWVIVSNGSTDRTDEIVNKYAAKYDFIQLIHVDSDEKRNFSSKVKAFNIGYQYAKNTKYEFIGNLDADVSFESSYYENILAKFHENSNMGIAGGEIFELYRGRVNKVVSSLWHVSGAIQLFRKQCYEEIAGFIPLDRGGEDAIALIQARMHGWEMKKFPHIRVIHHRRADTAKGNVLFGKFRWGIFDYSCGYHPVYEIIKMLYRIRERPYILASLLRFGGYCFALLRREPRVLPYGVVKYVRQEQMERLVEIISRIPWRILRKIRYLLIR